MTTPLPPGASREALVERLHLLEERERLAFEAAAMGIWDYRPATGQVSWSETLQRLWGYAPGTFPGTLDALRARLHPDDCERVLAGLEEALQQDAVFLDEHRIVLPDGEERWFIAKGRRFLGADGTVERLSGVSIDITGRKRASLSAEEAGLRLALAVDAGGFGIWEWELASHRVIADERALALFGFPPDAGEMPLGSYAQRVQPEDWVRLLAETERAFQERRHFRCEYRVHRPDGSLHWVASLGRPRYRADGEPDGMLGVVQEVTAEKEAETILRREADLRLEFLSVASHELSTPLMSLRLYAELARRHLQAEAPVARGEMLRFVRNVEGQVQHLERLVGDMLDVSRIETGQLGLRLQRGSLTAAAGESCERLRSHAAARGCAFRSAIEPGLEAVFDPLRIDQVLTNLVNNALRHGAGSPVEVRLRREGGRAVLEVEDRGPGIPPAAQRRIFERFERAPGTGTGGFGLGLYIVREIVHGHGGSVSIESAPGCGATFRVTLPLEQTTAREL